MGRLVDNQSSVVFTRIRFIRMYGSIISFLIFYNSVKGCIILLPPEVVL